MNAIRKRNATRTVPKAAVSRGVRHLVLQDTERDGGETLFTSPSIAIAAGTSLGVVSSPLTTPLSSAGQTVADRPDDAPDENIVDIGFPLLDVRRLRIVREPYLEEDTRKVLREFDP